MATKIPYKKLNFGDKLFGAGIIHMNKNKIGKHKAWHERK